MLINTWYLCTSEFVICDQCLLPVSESMICVCVCDQCLCLCLWPGVWYLCELLNERWFAHTRLPNKHHLQDIRYETPILQWNVKIGRHLAGKYGKNEVMNDSDEQVLFSFFPTDSTILSNQMTTCFITKYRHLIDINYRNGSHWHHSESVTFNF